VTDSCTITGDSILCKIKIFDSLQFSQTFPDVYVCQGEAVTLKANTNTGSGKLDYLWYDAAGNTLSTNDSLQITPATSLQIILKVTDLCRSIYDSAMIYSFAKVNDLQLLTDIKSGCEPLTVNFETPPLSFSNAEPCEGYWDFGDGNNLVQSFNNSSSTIKARHKFTNAGMYNITLKLRFKNSVITCLSLSTSVEALRIPEINLNITPKKITLPASQCNAMITTSNADSVVISWGDGFTDQFNLNLSLISQIHDYADTGHYLVKATAYNKNTCYTETETIVNHADTFTCFIPNAFTPNKDAANETFKPVLSFCKSYELTIYNRWGTLVYSGSNLFGKAQEPEWTGGDLPPGTYIYIINAKDGENKAHHFKGTVMLVR
jgi:gliding motility-associated-like protein